MLLCAQHASAQRTALAVDTAASRIYAITHRTGLLSFLGHEHVVTASRYDAELCIHRTSPDQSYARLVIDARTLVIDADSARRMAGLGRGPSSNQRAQIQAKMLDAEHLNVSEFPEMRFESTTITTRDWRTVQVEGRLTIRGVTQVVEFPASLEQDAAGRFTFWAHITVKQSAFGIKPESIAGVVKVADAIDLHIRLATDQAGQTCR